MKKIITSLLIAVTSIYGTIVMAQQDPVNSLFEKYAGKEGFTTVHVTGDLLKMAAKIDPEDKDMEFLSRLTEIKVLAQECKEGQPSGLNFYAEIWPVIDKSAYKELLIVKEKDQDVKMLARENGDIVFVEVKTIEGEGSPQEMNLAAQNVHWQKQQRLIRTAKTYLTFKKIAPEVLWRIDVLLVAIDPRTGLAKIEHLENAVWGR